MRVRDAGARGLRELLGRFGLGLRLSEPGCEIPGSYWGAPEAGLVGDMVHASEETPVHSVLHETCHYLCMTPSRRLALHTDAGGDYDEENCVCFMQIVLASSVCGFGQTRMLTDMDTWGYTFRLGSAAAWFSRDAEDARGRLRVWGLLDERDQPTWRVRGLDTERAIRCA